MSFERQTEAIEVSVVIPWQDVLRKLGELSGNITSLVKL